MKVYGPSAICFSKGAAAGATVAFLFISLQQAQPWGNIDALTFFLCPLYILMFSK